MIRWLMICLVVQSLKGDAVYNECKPSRKKRVVFGTPVLDMNSEYGSVRYVVWMASSHNCDNSPVTIRRRPCAPNSEYNLCGGSLLTQSIVQTACHCIARFAGEQKDGFRSPVTKIVWQDAYTIYPGAIPVSEVKGEKAKNYISHPRCREHKPSKVVLHDYGLIVLGSDVDAHGVRPAPVYTVATLANIWTGLMAKKTVCLHVGYGAYKLKRNNQVDHTAPPVLMHGWVRAQGYLECYDNIRASWNYSDATVFCTKSLPTTDQCSRPGDSGSPISSDNQYAGMVSFIAHSQKGRFHIFSISMSTAFTIYENSMEYREALTTLVNFFSKYDPTSKVFMYRPTAPKIDQYHANIVNLQIGTSL